ncbi:DUF5955 family protein [Streptomyces sp. NPDC018031]|uniref:DUF5955 family protein n=1 Tax=Streptomyces sp. NPDC018031 TaxID=3365033 RepID=UPI0037A17EF6
MLSDDLTGLGGRPGVPVREGVAGTAGTRVIGADEDPRAGELLRAVARLRRELATHPADLPERPVAEEELAALAAVAAAGLPEPARLRRSLLVIAGALGSVSALAAALASVRHAVDLFGPVPPVRGVG